jgi:hypothetical protein
MGGIWSQQAPQEDEEESVDGSSEYESTDVSEDEKSASFTSTHPPLENEKPTHTTANNNVKSIAHKDKTTHSPNVSNKTNDNNGNNDDNSHNNKTPTVQKANNHNNIDKQEEYPATRQWRSNSARGLKRVELQNVNILVVDDDAVQRAVLRKWLHDEKYKNGIKFLARCSIKILSIRRFTISAHLIIS